MLKSQNSNTYIRTDVIVRLHTKQVPGALYTVHINTSSQEQMSNHNHKSFIIIQPKPLPDMIESDMSRETSYNL